MWRAIALMKMISPAWTCLDSQVSNHSLWENSFGYVNELIIDGLPELESIKIGINSFYSYGGDHMFSVKNCPKLRELKIGPSCFYTWDSVEIESVPSLEVIEIGYLYYSSGNFMYAPLELKSSNHRMEMINRPAQA